MNPAPPSHEQRLHQFTKRLRQRLRDGRPKTRSDAIKACQQSLTNLGVRLQQQQQLQQVQLHQDQQQLEDIFALLVVHADKDPAAAVRGHALAALLAPAVLQQLGGAPAAQDVASVAGASEKHLAGTGRSRADRATLLQRLIARRFLDE